MKNNEARARANRLNITGIYSSYTLCDATTDEELRPATDAEILASNDLRDTITVAGDRCYVDAY